MTIFWFVRWARVSLFSVCHFLQFGRIINIVYDTWLRFTWISFEAQPFRANMCQYIRYVSMATLATGYVSLTGPFIIIKHLLTWRLDLYNHKIRNADQYLENSNMTVIVLHFIKPSLCISPIYSYLFTWPMRRGYKYRIFYNYCFNVGALYFKTSIYFNKTSLLLTNDENIKSKTIVWIVLDTGAKYS